MESDSSRASPRGVRVTATRRRSPDPATRPTRPSFSIRSIRPVALCGRNSNRSAPAHPHPPRVAAVLTDADFDAVLADYGEVLDIGRDDLKALYTELRGRAEEQRQALERV